MSRIGAYALACTLAAAVLSPTPGTAFGLNIGPFHLGLPFPGSPHRFVHRRMALRSRARGALYDKANLSAAPPSAADLGALYPDLTTTGLFDDIFRPDRSSPWPFSYEALFRGAFAKSLPNRDAEACHQGDATSAIVKQIGRETRPDATQRLALQKLGRALGEASGALASACPKQVPSQPVARLRLMQAQIEALSATIDLIRPPLQQFEQSLHASQLTRFASTPPASAATTACGAPTAIGWSVDDIDRSVQPGNDQRGAISELRQALASAAVDLDAHCPKPLPADPLARLEAIEARLDSSWRAVLAMQVALATFEGRLTDQERGRFEATDVAKAQ